MILELSISKRLVNRASGYKEEYVFSVLDLDKAEEYPANFVCVLPRIIQREGNPKCSFPRIFGKDSYRIAVELLTNALKSESDLGVKDEIERRLKALQPKPTAKCPICGCTFEPRKFGHFLQAVCRNCRNKNSPRQ